MGGKYPSISTITGYRECFRLYRGLGRIGGIFPSNNNVMAHEETMADETLHLGISYEKGIDPKTVADFEADVATQGLVVKTNERSKSGPFAGIEWLLPTAIMVIIAKPYFDSFLREAGEDHYHILKKELVKLGQKFLGNNAPTTTLIYTKGKALSSTPKYSLVFSVYGEIKHGLRLKLLVEPDTDEGDLERAISAFISTLVSIHNGTYQPGQMEGFDGIEPIGGTVLVTYDCKVSKLVVIDPRPKNFDDKS